jgi:hypothetical protein
MKANGKLANPTLAAAVIIGGLSLSAASAQDTQTRAVEQYTCKDVMRESGSDRDVAIAFLHGFLLGKAGTSTFKLDVLHKQSTEFIERCLNSPTAKAVDVMSKLKSQ